MAREPGQPGLHRKLAELRAELNGQIKKGEVNDRLKYSFVEATTVGRLFVAAASERNLTMLPIDVQWDDNDAEQTNIKGNLIVRTVRMLWQITDGDTGESIVVVSAGQGADMGDKAIPKALTNAMKYAILLVLQATGDDPEADSSTDEANGEKAKGGSGPSTRKTSRRRTSTEDDGDGAVSDSKDLATSEQKAMVRAKAREINLEDDGLKALSFNATGKESSREWTSKDVSKILARLERPEIVDTFRDMKEYRA